MIFFVEQSLVETQRNFQSNLCWIFWRILWENPQEEFFKDALCQNTLWKSTCFFCAVKQCSWFIRRACSTRYRLCSNVLAKLKKRVFLFSSHDHYPFSKLVKTKPPNRMSLIIMTPARARYVFLYTRASLSHVGIILANSANHYGNSNYIMTSHIHIQFVTFRSHSDNLPPNHKFPIQKV